ncbi:tRNA-binding protein [Dinghuibacter silviterrae]|uniref:tRNA-binding protein n=1 Tax=Dinghuibacter silviterrae TaxID=1539049 RepID=A0A4R8DUB6_9BACT|nr:tRNA-binding protein [Dinghuibacter silviterrae]TDX01749.1 tRNA-binding protein [Dinghuibacter silviterrae]
METILPAEFEKLDIRVGTVTAARVFPEARKPAYQLEVDFGPLGVKRSSAQITAYYAPDDLVGRQVIGLVNLPPKRIAGFMSECLVLGVYDTGGQVVLLQPDRAMENGCKIG